MCYSGSCPYESPLPDGDCSCRKPDGEPCPYEVGFEDEVLNEHQPEVY